MDSDAKLQTFLLLAKSAHGRALEEIINRATSEPGIFTFGELLDAPAVAELRTSESKAYALLQLFAYGSCSDHAANASSLPPLNAQQLHKLKQLTVVSLAAKHQLITYDTLQAALSIATVRELEDFLITECFARGIVRGKLDQQRRCLQVFDSMGRDVRPEEVPLLRQALDAWVQQSEGVMRTIEERVAYSMAAAEAARKHREEVDAKTEEVRKNIKISEADLRTGEAMLLDEALGLDLMEDDRMGDGDGIGMRESGRGPRPSGRPKSRRR